ncbi:TlpA disulfide reductase family protein [Vineibacter terrae]|uniref:TlpA family protein disulfide reductase n=1 Tax=Vineibacter terrae TaxID=2586908 RepID=UPI002E3085A6|nr:TlpA disulfide reductase family protein [Vineibacter terrae]HEX2885382.1 TlpA disulfide reductase family protein [Vineibacter terrae]
MAQLASHFSFLVRALGALAIAAGTALPVAAKDAKPPLAGDMTKLELQVERTAAPALAFKDKADADASLDAFRGKVVLVNFWATWCIPCVKEMPSLDRLAAKIGSEKFVVVALSLDGPSRPKVEPFIRSRKLDNLQVFFDTQKKSYGALRIAVLPTSVLFDAQGREVGRLQGDADWDTPEAEALVRHVIGDGS